MPICALCRPVSCPICICATCVIFTDLFVERNLIFQQSSANILQQKWHPQIFAVQQLRLWSCWKQKLLNRFFNLSAHTLFVAHLKEVICNVTAKIQLQLQKKCFFPFVWYIFFIYSSIIFQCISWSNTIKVQTKHSTTSVRPCIYDTYM